MISLLPQIQLLSISFLSSFILCFIFSYVYNGYLKYFHFILRAIFSSCIFIVATKIYFDMCLKYYNAVFSYYQIAFLIIGIIIFYKYYYRYFYRLIYKREIKTYKFIEKFKKSLYNLINKMGGIFRGRSRKKSKESCSND